MGSGLSIQVTGSQLVKYLTLNGIDYYGIVYNGTIPLINPPQNITVMDSKTISGINGALGDIVMFYKASSTAIPDMTAAFNQIVTAFGPQPNCAQPNNQFPIQCSNVNIDLTGRRIVFQLNILSISVVGDIINTFEVNLGNINASYLLSSDKTSSALNFFVPDYFVQAQNDDKLNAKNTFSYMPNFDLALHKPTTNLEKKRDCRCKEKYQKYEKCGDRYSDKKCKCKPKPFTNTTDIHNLLNKIYNIAYLVEMGHLTPALGEEQVLALWKSFEKFEIRDIQNFKSIDVNGDNGIITMLVRYRLSNSEVIVAMSITGTYLNNLFFNVSTIPISGDNEPDAKHSFNKAISQYVTNISNN